MRVEASGLDLDILPLWQQARWRPETSGTPDPGRSLVLRRHGIGRGILAAALADSGLSRHAVLGSLLENGSDAVLALLAAWRLGAVHCP